MVAGCWQSTGLHDQNVEVAGSKWRRTTYSSNHMLQTNAVLQIHLGKLSQHTTLQDSYLFNFGITKHFQITKLNINCKHLFPNNTATAVDRNKEHRIQISETEYRLLACGVGFKVCSLKITAVFEFYSVQILFGSPKLTTYLIQQH